MTRLFLAADEALAVLTRRGADWRCELHTDLRRAQCVAVDPLEPRLACCGTFGNGLFRSDDAGRSWLAAGQGIDHSKIFSVSLSPTERTGGRGVVYAGTEPSTVFRSEDAGVSWRACSDLTELPSSGEWSFPPRPETHHVRWIHPDPHVAGRLFVAVEAGALVRSPDGGRSWSDRVETGPFDTHQLATHEGAPGRLCSAAGDGYFESVDGGDTWQQPQEGLEHRYLWSVAVDSGDAETVIVAAGASARRSHYAPEAKSYLYRRAGCGSWRQVGDGLPDGGGRRTAVLAADPEKSETFFAAWEEDLFRSTDGGLHWEALEVEWPAGFRVGEPRGLVVAPAP